MKFTLSLCSLSSFITIGFSIEPEYEVVYRKLSGLQATDIPSYDCTMINLWTAARHPEDYPDDAGTFAGDAHWSPPIWVAHSSSYHIFEAGEMATEGLEMVAETGNPSVLHSELEVAAGDIFSTQTGSPFVALDLFPQDFVPNVTMDVDHSYLSVVSMIAPSPSWFSGLNSYPMFNGEYWYDEVILDIFPWNSGTDAGDTYTSPDEDSDEPIVQFTIDTIPDTMVFASPDENTVLPTARVNCKLNFEAPEKLKKKKKNKKKKNKKKKRNN